MNDLEMNELKAERERIQAQIDRNDARIAHIKAELAAIEDILNRLADTELERLEEIDKRSDEE